MSYLVVITDQAEADIDRNALWWAEHHSVDQAIAWLQIIRQQINSLSTMPDRFSVAPENDLFAYEIRQCSVGLGSRPGYRAVYTVTSNRVVVLAVRRGAEDTLQPDDLPGSI